MLQGDMMPREDGGHPRPLAPTTSLQPQHTMSALAGKMSSLGNGWGRKRHRRPGQLPGRKSDVIPGRGTVIEDRPVKHQLYTT